MKNIIMIHKRLLPLITLIFALLLPSTGIAKIAGHNVIFIHGFLPQDLLKPPSEERVLSRKQFGSLFWMQRADGFLKWSAAQRIEGGIAKMVLDQAKKHSESKLCKAGCVLVTHSTGDLVARHFLANQESWLKAEGYEPLKIVATIDFGGAGGGTEIANKAYEIVNSPSVPIYVKMAIGAVLELDFDLHDYRNIGTLNDLRTSTARNIANWPNDIPRLRFSGSGNVLATPLIKTLIHGESDGVVPAHSSCGSASPKAIDSCSNHVRYDGKVSNVTGPSGLLHNHFPVLMSDDYGHLQITRDIPRGRSTYVQNNFNNNGLKVDIETYIQKKTTGRWFWKKTRNYQYVEGSLTKSFTRTVYDALNTVVPKAPSPKHPTVVTTPTVVEDSNCPFIIMW